MRVALLTFHRGINHGSALQAYCLQEVLRGYGHEVSILDYVNREHGRIDREAFLYFKPWLSARANLRRLQNVRKVRAFRRFQERELNLHRVNGVLPSGERDGYDALVIGSDEVWNLNKPWMREDLIYFGQGLAFPRVVTYAVSCGDFDRPEALPGGVPELVRAMTAISVRDHNTKALVDGLTGGSAPLVADPTLLYPATNLVEEVREEQPYLLAYLNFLSAAHAAVLRTVARENSWKTVAASYPHAALDESHVHVGVGAWLGYFKQARAIVTNTYHGTIFAILSGRPFAVLDPGPKRLKIASLLEQLGLSERLVFGSEELMWCLNEPVDESRLRTRLDALVGNSRKFLEAHL